MKEMIKNKKGVVDMTKLVTAVVLIIVAVIVIFLLVGNLAPEIITASNNISGSGLPLASLFSSSGIVLLILMIGIFLTVIVLAFKMAAVAKGGK